MNSFCLANHCRLFRCEYLMSPSSGPKKCYESTMINLKNRCKVIKNKLCSFIYNLNFFSFIQAFFRHVHSKWHYSGYKK